MEKFILLLFVILKFIEYFIEKYLLMINRQYYLNSDNQKKCKQILNISDKDFEKTLNYTEDNHKFIQFSKWINITIFMIFLISGGFGYIEQMAIKIGSYFNNNDIIIGIIVFLILGAISFIYNIPFELYDDFVIEEKHGFNTKTIKIFIIDKLKTLLISIILGLPLMCLILWIMQVSGNYWWILAWLVVIIINILMLWIYPAILAPLFNKFEPLSDEHLKQSIYELANKINFKIDNIFVMDASKRSTHGNAYFTGISSKKRIVLFDTLLKSLSLQELLAVIAHELGHFKLHHIKTHIIINILLTGVAFYLLSIFLHQEIFYLAFKFKGVSNYAALIVFFLWFNILNMILMPIINHLARIQEFNADKFAVELTQSRDFLYKALLKLREQNHNMPIAHPLYSTVYYSHPPLLQRLHRIKNL